MNLYLLAGMDLGTGVLSLLILCLVAVCFFEFVNGFHDTANAVATVIYTHSMRPTTAVILSGLFNFVGVLFGGLGVAMSILKLLPLTDLMYAPLGENVAFLMAVLVSAISWNLGTWYFGIPASSSHTLIGALIGASLVFGNVSPDQMSKAYEIFMFLFITPVIGFVGAWVLLSLMRLVVKNDTLYQNPDKDASVPPPLWIRLLIISGCVGVSYNHGSNDGQKGVGLLMVVLIAFIPASFALRPDFDTQKCTDNLQKIEQVLIKAPINSSLSVEVASIRTEISKTKDLLSKMQKAGEIAPKDLKVSVRRQIRDIIPTQTKLLVKKAAAAELAKTDSVVVFDKNNRDFLSQETQAFANTYTDFAPSWTILLISLCLGLGTMIGWKRIVETIGEKIGKSGFDYSQGFVSQLVSSATIWLSTFFKLPVSTTHIVSSSIMGAMFAKGGRQNIQRKTVTNILMAWALTLPVSIGLSAGFYYIFRFIF